MSGVGSRHRVRWVRLGPLYAHWGDGAALVSVFRWRLAVTDHRRHRPPFSERYGYTKRLHVGPYCFGWPR